MGSVIIFLGYSGLGESGTKDFFYVSTFEKLCSTIRIMQSTKRSQLKVELHRVKHKKENTHLFYCLLKTCFVRLGSIR